MSSKKEILESIKERLAFIITEFGLSTPVVREQNGMSILNYFSEYISIEFEIDWREQSVYTLVVRLESGELPAGYYVSKGQKCRKHLTKLLSDIGVFRSQVRPSGKRVSFDSQIEGFANLLSEHLGHIVEMEESDLFN